MKSIKNTESVREHILVCLSASPSNEKIIKTAAKMFNAFGIIGKNKKIVRKNKVFIASDFVENKLKESKI